MQLKNQLCFQNIAVRHTFIFIKVAFQRMIINYMYLYLLTIERKEKKNHIYINQNFIKYLFNMYILNMYHIHKHDKYVHYKYMYISLMHFQ